MTANLTDCPGDGLIIGAHNITLNLNGRTIDGVGLGVGIRVYAVAGNTDGGGNRASGNAEAAQCSGVVCTA